MDITPLPPEQHRLLVDSCPDALVVIRDGLVVFANPRAVELAGADDVQALLGRRVQEFVPPDARSTLSARYNRLRLQQGPVVTAEQVSTISGQVLSVETAARPIDYEGRPAVLVCARDITARQRTEEALWSAERRFSAAFHAAPVGMLLLTPSGVVLDANQAVGELIGGNPRELIGQSALELIHPAQRDTFADALRILASGERSRVSGEWRLAVPDVETDSDVWVFGSVSVLPGEPPALVVHLLDISERRAVEERLAHRALHDALTGLPNRALFFDRLAQAVRAARRENGRLAVLYLDLNGFKGINDTHGHATGDRVLMEVARRLTGALRPADTVARLGGDEYAVIAEGLPKEAVRELARRLRESLAPPIGELQVTASIGIAHSDDVELESDALLRAADTEMYRAKARWYAGHSEDE